MRILGLDPGVATTGFGVVASQGRTGFTLVAYGTIRTPAGIPLGERLRMIRHDLSELIARHQPECAALEILYFNRNVRTAMAVGEVRGVLALTLHENAVPTSEYGPGVVKRTVAGYGQSSKRQVAEMVKRLLGLPQIPRPDDAADALALALCRGMQARFAQPAGPKAALIPDPAAKRKAASLGRRSFDKEGGV